MEIQKLAKEINNTIFIIVYRNYRFSGIIAYREVLVVNWQEKLFTLLSQNCHKLVQDCWMTYFRQKYKFLPKRWISFENSNVSGVKMNDVILPALITMNQHKTRFHVQKVQNVNLDWTALQRVHMNIFLLANFKNPFVYLTIK